MQKNNIGIIRSSNYYTPLDLAKLGRVGMFPYKNHITILKMIKNKRIKALNTNKKGVPRYKILGSDIISFMNDMKV